MQLKKHKIFPLKKEFDLLNFLTLKAAFIPPPLSHENSPNLHHASWNWAYLEHLDIYSRVRQPAQRPSGA